MTLICLLKMNDASVTSPRKVLVKMLKYHVIAPCEIIWKYSASQNNLYKSSSFKFHLATVSLAMSDHLAAHAQPPWYAVFLKHVHCFALPSRFLHLPADPCGCFNIHLNRSLVPAWPAESNTMTAVSVGLNSKAWETLVALSFSGQLELRERTAPGEVTPWNFQSLCIGSESQ